MDAQLAPWNERRPEISSVTSIRRYTAYIHDGFPKNQPDIAAGRHSEVHAQPKLCGLEKLPPGSFWLRGRASATASAHG